MGILYEAADPSMLNLAERLIYEKLEAGAGENTALEVDDLQISYADLARDVQALAGVLAREGVQAGDRVPLFLSDTELFVVAFFAILHLGAIAVPLNPAYSGEDVEPLLKRLEPRLIIMREDLEQKLAPYCPYARYLASGTLLEPGQLEAKLIDSRDNRVPPIVRGADQVAYILHSSGTTGIPKAIPHRHEDILFCIKSYSLGVLQMIPEDKVLAVPKLTFGYGLGGNLLSALYVGGSSILVPDISTPESILMAAERHQPTLFLAQPRILVGLLQAGGSEALLRLRLAVSAGEVLSPTLRENWIATTGVDLLDGFGSTEVGHVFISNRPGKSVPGSAGQVVDGFEVKIVDDNDHPVPTDVPGHLLVRGPSLARGYYNDPARTAEVFVDDWVRTGDVFRVDPDGNYFALGRADEMIKVGCGQWVSPLELEAWIQSDTDVAECAIAPYSSEDGILEIKACVVLIPGCRPTAAITDRLLALVCEKSQEMLHKHLGAVEYLSSLPRSVNGKLQRHKLGAPTLTEFAYGC